MTHALARAIRLITQKSALKTQWEKRNSHDSIVGYLSQIESKGSKFLANYLDLSGTKTFLELGSNCGNRLLPLALKFPNTQFTAIDINSAAIELGKEQTQKLGLQNVTMLTMDITSNEFFEFIGKNTYDMVFSWATFMYLHPRDLRKLVRTLSKSSKKFVLIEQCISQASVYGFNSLPARNLMQWKHNYIAIFTRCKPSEFEIHFELGDLPPGLWEPGGGGGKIVSMQFS
jgi:cyclopropane fatty-acyl-phospholipid synthase-like methyltransferase